MTPLVDDGHLRRGALTVDLARTEPLFAIDEALVIFPREWAATRSKAAYRGWRELHAMSIVDSPFYPPAVTVHSRYAYRFTADAFAEITHHTTKDPHVPGAYPVWVVEVDPAW